MNECIEIGGERREKRHVQQNLRREGNCIEGWRGQSTTMVQRNCEREERWRVREKEREGGKGRER